MASYTSNLNLKKPALTDDALVTDLNDNSDKLDAAISAGSGAIAIVSVGNTHAAISSGQYVYVRQHGSLSEGLYKATTNIAANGTLSGSNLTAVSGGGLNSVYSALSDQIAKFDAVISDKNTLYSIMNDTAQNSFQAALETAYQNANNRSYFIGFSNASREGFWIGSKHDGNRGFAIIGSGYTGCMYIAYRDNTANDGTWYARKFTV